MPIGSSLFLIAALLFAAGVLEGWRYRAQMVVASSMLIALTCLPLWMLTNSFDIAKLLVLLAYLAAHQSGYLVGAYLGAAPHRDRSARAPGPDDPAGLEMDHPPQPDRLDQRAHDDQ